MSTVIEQLLQVVERDPTPSIYTSSYWQEYAAQNTVRMEAGRLVLRDYGIGQVAPLRMRARLLQQLERATYWPVTSGLPEYSRIWRMTVRLARRLNFGLTFDVWKMAVILALLTDHWKQHRLSPRTFAIIGDGHGFLGALIRHARPEIRLYCIDLPKTLVFQATTHQRADQRLRLAFWAERAVANGESAADVTLVLPQAIERITQSIDCAINVASMQEMNAATIRAYFDFLRRRSGPQSRFYCVNRTEKVLPGGEVAQFADYPWQANDEVFIDGVCPYYRYYLSRYAAEDGPRLWGWRIPLTQYFGGPHWHRLVRLAAPQGG